jgi:ubiquinone biosynthesis protein
LLGRTIANLGRLRQITTVVAKHGLSHVIEDRRRRRAADGEEAEPDGDAAIAALGRRFRAILEDLGPTFIKFGQVLSTRADLLPPQFVEALRGLQDDCPPMAFADVRRVIAEGLGKPIEEAFASFDEQPVASASVAQVHRAILKSGEEVAVKVRRSGVSEQILRDLDLLRYLALLAEAIIEESGLLMPRGIVEEFENAFLAELDFASEAKNMRIFSENLRGQKRSYIVPRVYDELSCRTVLTMEFIRGTRLGDLGPTHDKQAIARNIVSAAFDQLFVDGVFHADSHPGNVFVLDDGRLALIDFGAVGRISYAMRETLVALVTAVGTRDAETVARLLYRAGIPDGRVSLHQLRDACASLFNAYLRDQAALSEIQASQLLTELFGLAARFRVRIPSEYALIGRAGATVEGIVRQLDPKLQVLESVRPYLLRLVEEQFSLPSLGEGALKNVLRARGLWRELPLTASQILMDLESGKLQIQVASRDLETVAKNINAVGLVIFVGLLASSLITGSMFILARHEIELWGWPVVPLGGLYLASLLAGAGLGWYFLSPRLRKISVGRLFGRRRRRRMQLP